MKTIETLEIGIVAANQIDIASGSEYNANAICQCCGNTVTPVTQKTGVNYYYVVNDRVICPQHLAEWLQKIGLHIANNPHPYWLHAIIQD